MTASVCVEHSPLCMLCWPTTASEGDEAVMQGMIAATGICKLNKNAWHFGLCAVTGNPQIFLKKCYQKGGFS